MVNDGFDNWKQLLRESMLDREIEHAWVVEYGFLKVMQKIVEDNEPALVLESDVFFNEITWEKITERWRELVELVGYDDIKFAMLYFRKRENLPWAEPLTDFWATGVNGSGQVANIVTPHGAQFMLDREGEPWNLYRELPAKIQLNPRLLHRPTIAV